MYYTYILFCSNLKNNKNIFYVGSSSNLKGRIQDHKNKSVESTKNFDKVELIYYEACLNKTDSIKRENQLKTGFGRGYIKRRMDNYLKSLRN